MNNKSDSLAPARDNKFGLLRVSAALGASIALLYAVWEMWTAIWLSADASLSWRMQLLLLEGGVPLMFALGFGCAACSKPAIRRVGWWLILSFVLSLIVWTWLVPVHPSTANSNYTILQPLVLVATLDQATRRELVGAAGREYSAQLFAFGARCCASYGVDSTIAQDAVQDIFIALLAEHDRAGTSYAVLQGDPSQLKAYLFRAVQLRVQTLARGENRRAVNEGYVALVQADRMTLSPAELYDAGEFEKYIDATLAQCPDRAVQAYRLVREHELTYKETGKVMGISTQTVGAHLNLIAKRLQAAVRAWQSSASGDVV